MTLILSGFIATESVSVVATDAVAAEATTGASANIDFIPSLFTATSKEYNSGLGSAWEDFVTSIVSRQSRLCMKAKGYPESELGPNSINAPSQGSVPDNIQFPDITRLESGSFGQMPGPSEPSPGSGFGSSDDQPSSWKHDLIACSNKAGAPFAAVTRKLAPLQKIWQSDMGYNDNNLMSRASVVKAMAGWRSCVGQDGVQVVTLDSFFGYVDQVEQKSESTSSPEIRRLAELYGKCIGPVSRAMDAVRLSFRHQIVDQYAPQLVGIQSTMSKLVSRVAKHYGINYGSGD